MSLPIQDKQEFSSICRELLDKFSVSFPNAAFHLVTLQALGNLLCRPDDYDGEPGEWVGGLVYLIAKHDPRFTAYEPRIKLPTFLNRELEAIFGVSMRKIRKRADRLWPVAFPGVFPE